MKKLIILALAMLFVIYGYSQTNTFPASGNVGIGTLNPSSKLDVIGGINASATSALSGITFGDFDSYTRKLQPAGYNFKILSGDGNSALSIPFNSGAPAHFENYELIVDRNVGIGTYPLSGGGGAKWLTIDGATYSGGVIYSVNGTPKGYSYYNSPTDGLLYQAVQGVPISFLPNGITSLKLNTDGSSVFSGPIVGTISRFSGNIQSTVALSDIVNIGTISDYPGYHTNNGGYWGIRSGTGNTFNIDTYNYNSPINAFKIAQMAMQLSAGM